MRCHAAWLDLDKYQGLAVCGHADTHPMNMGIAKLQVIMIQ
jgi:hypothetical protein